MLRNYIVVALRNISRNPLYAAVSVFGLAVGICAALLAAIVIESEYHYDVFIPGYERTYLIVGISNLTPGGRLFHGDETNGRVAKLLQLHATGIEAIARTAKPETPTQEVFLRHGDIEASEPIYWADPSIFRVLPFPVAAGDLTTALDRPDGIVLTRSLARKYFGREDVLGQTILLERKEALVVTAVIEDLPASRFIARAFLSGRASFSQLYSMDRSPFNANPDIFPFPQVSTYVRLKPGASFSQVQRALPHIAQQMWPGKPPGTVYSLEIVRLDEAHSYPPLNPELRPRLLLMTAVAVLILLVSCINFINLVTARSATRAKEVAVRKAVGASRPALIVQFIGESLVYVLLATALAFALAEWLLPYVNAFFQSQAVFDWWNKPELLGWMALGVICLAVLVGAYPGFVLSSFRPVGVFKGLNGDTRAVNGVRQVLVTLQFAVLIGLMIAAGVVWRQREFATGEALRFDTDQMLMLRSVCRPALTDALRRLPGVRDVGCSSIAFLGDRFVVSSGNRPGGSKVPLPTVPVEFGVLEAYHIVPIAGALRVPPTVAPAGMAEVASSRIVINESASRLLGFKSPAEAIGRTLTMSWPTLLKTGGTGETVVQNEIIAVVPNFSFDTVEHPIRPLGYYVQKLDPDLPAPEELVHVKLAGQSLPETLKAIDAVWAQFGDNRPVMRFFADEHFQKLYASMLRQAQGFAVFCAVALLLACLGLVALASSVAERRTREIGVRKAMGASKSDIVRLLLWQFGKPVLWANVVAWPIAGYLMNRWLQGFAYHASLEPIFFIAAAGVTLAIALLTVSAHSVLVARAKPVLALRYE